MGKEKIKNMADFSKRSGISRPTISKYFNDPNSVHPKTRIRIEKAVKDFDYQPNIFAINHNRKRSKNIGIVVPLLSDPFFAEMARIIEQRCREEKFWPTLFSAHGSPEIEVDILSSLLSLRPSGVLIAPLGKTSDRSYLEKFCQQVPTVLFDSNVEGLGRAFIGSNNDQSIFLIVEHLCKTGEPPCFFEMAPVNPNANKKRNAFCKAMKKLGHEPHIIRVQGDSWNFEEIGFQGGLKALEEKSFKTNTVLCSNDRLAIGFLAACYEKGLKVGHGADCSIRVAGHDDHPFARFTSPSLTTVGQDYKSISNLSAETLFSYVKGEVTPHKKTLFDGKLIIRNST